MKKVVRFDVENGYYLFKLEKILNDKKISINKLMRDTNTDFKVLKRIITGNLLQILLNIFQIKRIKKQIIR